MWKHIIIFNALVVEWKAAQLGGEGGGGKGGRCKPPEGWAKRI